MTRAAVARTAPARAARLNQLFVARTDMVTSEWSGRTPYYAEHPTITCYMDMAFRAATCQESCWFRMLAPRGRRDHGNGGGARFSATPSKEAASPPPAGARDRDAGRRQPERRYLRGLVALTWISPAAAWRHSAAAGDARRWRSTAWGFTSRSCRRHGQLL